MPETRQLNTPEQPSPEYSTQLMAETPQMGMPMNAGDYRYDQLVDPTKLKNLQTGIIRHLDDVRRYSKQGRDNRKFDERRDRNRNRAQVKVDVTINDDGSVNKKLGDGHAKLGINQGWTFQANVTAAKELYFKIFRTAPRFYVIQGWGRKEENEKLEHILERVAEHLLRKGGFYSTIATRLTQMLPIDGTVFLRFNITYPHQMVRIEDGSFEERMKGETSISGEPRYTLFDTYKAFTPQFDIWKVEDVLVTDWDLPYADQQEGVFFVTPQTTLARLERDEAVYVWTGKESDIGLEFIEEAFGRFTNLRSLREKQSGQLSGSPRTSSTQYQEESSRTTSFLPFTLIEYEGQFPMSRFVKDKTLTPELAQYYGINVNYEPQMLPDGSYDPYSLDEWGRRLDAIRYWEIAYTGTYEPSGGSGNTNTEMGEHLLLMRPCPYREGRTSLKNFRYFPDRDELLGLSVCDVGWKLENAGDLIRNAVVWTHVFNSDPSALVNRDGLLNPTVEEAAKVAQPGQIVETTKRMSPGDVLAFAELKRDRNAEADIQSIKFEFENSTGIPAISKGASSETSTGTATELQMTQNRSSGLLDMIALNQAFVFCDTVKELLCLSYRILGPEEWEKLAIEACGEIAADIEHVMNEVANEEFDVHPAIASTEDPAVVATMLLRVFQLTAESGEWNVRELIKLAASLQRIQGIEKALKSGDVVISPVSENILMAAGNTISVNVQDDDLAHLMEHQKMLVALQTGEAAQYFNPQQIEELNKNLPSHYESQFMQHQQKIMMQQQQQMGPGGGGQSGQPKNPRMDQPGALETDTAAAGTTGLRQNINERAGQVPGGNL